VLSCPAARLTFPRGYPLKMAVQTANASSIPISEQHVFLDFAKNYEWDAVKRQVNAIPGLVSVQPSGREGEPRWSALHQAAFSGDADAVRFLLAKGANADAKTKEGKRPCDIAKTSHIEMLLSPPFGFNEHLPTVPTPMRCKKSKLSMKAAAKSLKAKKAKKSKIAKGKRGKALVYKGMFQKTVGGLCKGSLTKSKSGKIVSKRSQAHGTKFYGNIRKWTEAFMQARIQLGLTGFVAVKLGSPLYVKTLEIYSATL